MSTYLEVIDRLTRHGYELHAAVFRREYSATHRRGGERVGPFASLGELDAAISALHGAEGSTHSAVILAPEPSKPLDNFGSNDMWTNSPYRDALVRHIDRLLQSVTDVLDGLTTNELEVLADRMELGRPSSTTRDA